MQLTCHISTGGPWYFSNLLHDCVEVYMDDFTVKGDTFDEALHNLEIFLQRCRETNLSLSNEKCFMIMTEGIFLGHHVFVAGKLMLL